MLLDKPLTLLPNGKQDVVGFMDYLENPRPPMAAADVVAYLAARMADQIAPVETGIVAGRTAKQPPKPTTPANSNQLIWKGRYRQNIVQFWLGINCPKGSLDEVIGVHSRIAPHFCAQDDAIDIFQQFVREMPEEAWKCSSRLLKQAFGRIDKNIAYAVKKAFAGNTNQPDPEKSSQKWKQIAKRFKQIGFDPFNKSTWHKGYTAFKVEVAWSDDDALVFNHSLKLLFGKAQHLDPVVVVNKVIALVLSKEKEKNGIALPYWQAFFEDQFGIACGYKGERRHQKLVQKMVELGIIHVCQGPMFNTEKNLARRFTVGAMVRAKPGWKAKLMTKEEMLREVLGCN